MFTGIIAGVGTIISTQGRGSDRSLTIRAGVLAGAQIGASVAIDGVCLTVTVIDEATATFDVSAETLRRTTLGSRAIDDVVNIERPLRAGDELGGHVVQGHVDAIGNVSGITPDGDGVQITIDVDADLARYIVVKGSVTVDGVSLTVAAVHGCSFTVALIPHTLNVTTLGGWQVGRTVNLEVDVLAKYVERLATPLAE